ncbi:GGDEF domain-containing protein [Lysinibacillus sphaericus]|uniref:GGDEF domain-containing protein n=1 Tax=Lysinibacillus sphaericus TaxID=1421 RepID=UPI003F796084
MENQENLALSLRKEMIQLNLKRMRTVAWTLMYISAIVTFIHFGEVFFSIKERVMEPTYIAIHTVLFYINLTVLLFVKEKRIHVNSLNIRKYEYVLLSYIYITILLITGITVMDVFYFNHAALYEVFFLILCSVFAISLRKMILAVLLTVPTILISAFLNVGMTGESIKVILPMSLIVPIGLVIQNRIYNMQKQFTKEHILLEEEMTKSKQLSKLLTEKNSELTEQALRDSLTNLPNRRAFNDKLEHMVQQHNKSKTLTFMIIDIDFFKNFNDYYGHLHGDEALIKVAGLLDEIALKYNAFVARWGGEEFVIVSQHAQHFAEHVCEEILEEVRNLKIRHEHSPIADVVTVSIGMCHAKVFNLQHIQTCCALADQALYTVKQNNRNHFHVKTVVFEEEVCWPV